jgi:hypothetical protein
MRPMGCRRVSGASSRPRWATNCRAPALAASAQRSSGSLASVASLPRLTSRLGNLGKKRAMRSENLGRFSAVVAWTGPGSGAARPVASIAGTELAIPGIAWGDSREPRSLIGMVRVIRAAGRGAESRSGCLGPRAAQPERPTRSPTDPNQSNRYRSIGRLPSPRPVRCRSTWERKGDFRSIPLPTIQTIGKIRERKRRILKPGRDASPRISATRTIRVIVRVASSRRMEK